MTPPSDTFDQTRALAQLESAGRKQQLSVGAVANIRTWLTEPRYADYAPQVAEQLADGRFDVLFTFGPGQSDQADAILAKTRRAPQLAPKMPSLKHYMWLVHCSQLYFGGDTGPMHLASAMGTPVVAVFGGTDPVRHSPMREPFTVLMGKEGMGEAGVEGIGAEEAYDACVSLLTVSGRG